MLPGSRQAAGYAAYDKQFSTNQNKKGNMPALQCLRKSGTWHDSMQPGNFFHLAGGFLENQKIKNEICQIRNF